MSGHGDGGHGSPAAGPPLPAEDDPFALDDGAYLLGALPPEQRAAYERHVQGCPDCARSLAQLSGLPGLLGRVPPEVAATLDEPTSPPDAPPPQLLDVLLARVQPPARRRPWDALRRPAVAAAVVLLAVAVSVGVSVGVTLLPREEPPGDPGVEVVELERARPGPLSVTARLTPRPWGTHIELHCRYEGGPASPYATPPTYTLLVRGTGGDVEQVGAWRAVAGREVVVETASALPPGAITGLEVRTAAGLVVLRAPAAVGTTPG